MTRRREWTVYLHGKWGGQRSVRVLATSPERARAAARDYLRSYEHVGTIEPVRDDSGRRP
jgi:xanthine dehydrogenase molybdopterin-binding subunit B